MRSVRLIGLTALATFLARAAPEDRVFDLKVTRVRTLRAQPGDLHIDTHGIAFRSNDGKTNIVIAIQDVRQASVADVRELRFETYEVRKWKPIERRKYRFRAQPDASIEELAQFLAARVHRPIVGHYPEDSQFKVAVYHRRSFGRTNGMLEIGKVSIQFISDRPTESRTWLYRDIETIGRPDSFRFRVSTNRETYVFELKNELPGAAYQFAWSKVYNLEKRQF
jgi:hypothetical protein